jgi:hypothetical protein
MATQPEREGIEEELEETIEPDTVFDCFDEACEECTVCKYLNFREWAEGCAPSGSTIERNPLIEDYLKRKATNLHQELQKATDELSQERTGFLCHIAKLEKTHQEELQKAREREKSRILKLALTMGDCQINNPEADAGWTKFQHDFCLKLTKDNKETILSENDQSELDQPTV